MCVCNLHFTRARRYCFVSTPLRYPARGTRNGRKQLVSLCYTLEILHFSYVVCAPTLLVVLLLYSPVRTGNTVRVSGCVLKKLFSMSAETAVCCTSAGKGGRCFHWGRAAAGEC